MENIVIPPASAATTGFMSSHGHHGDHRGHDVDWPSRTAERVKDMISGLERDQGEQTRDLLAAITSQNAAAAVAVEKTGAASVLTTERTSAANQLATNVAGQQVQNLLLQQSNLAAVQAQTFAAATLTAIEKTAAAALLDSERHASASALAAATNHCAVLASIAECCCKLEGLVREENAKGRDLQNVIQAQNQAAMLAEAKTENLIHRMQSDASSCRPAR